MGFSESIIHYVSILPQVCAGMILNILIASVLIVRTQYTPNETDITQMLHVLYALVLLR